MLGAVPVQGRPIRVLALNPTQEVITFEQIVTKLHSLSDNEKIILKAKKFGIIANNSLGIYHKDLQGIAKEIGQNNELAIKLFNSGIYEARILCSKIFKPEDVTENLMEEWVKTFENWEICDSFCMGLFAKNKLAVSKALEWSTRESEFEKRVELRTKKIIQSGIIDETREFYNQNLTQWAPLQSVGYKETVEYLRESKTQKWLFEAINLSTMQLIKKQKTWFKRVDAILWSNQEQALAQFLS